MADELQRIMREIEELRAKLQALMAHKKQTDQEILEVAQLLDEKINRYLTLIKGK